MKDSGSAFAADSAKSSASVGGSPKDLHSKQLEGRPFLTKPHQEEVYEHPLLIWTALAPGDAVSLHVEGTGDCVGTVESKTSDGLVIWIRCDLNERRLFHFHDCLSVRVLR